MTRTELMNALKALGFQSLCDDGKTLAAYNQVQYFLRCNRTPLKAISRVYLDSGELRGIVDGYDYEMGYSLSLERWLSSDE